MKLNTDSILKFEELYHRKILEMGPLACKTTTTNCINRLLQKDEYTHRTPFNINFAPGTHDTRNIWSG